MSMYLSFVIRNDFYGHNDMDASMKYAKHTLPLFQKLVDNKELTSCDGECLIEDYDEMEEAIFINFLCDGCAILNAKLMDGYWAFETFFDDYVLPYMGKKVLTVCRYLCSVLGQDEAWICVHDHATNSITAPMNFEHWIEYAQTFEIKELNEELIASLDHDNFGFKFEKFCVKGESKELSTPIYHIKV